MIKRFFTCIAAVAVMVSCTGKQELKTNTFEKFFEKGLTEDSEDTMSILIDIEYPTAGIPEEAIVKMTNAIMGHSRLGRPIGIEEAAEQYIQTRYSNYLQTMLPLYEEMKDEDNIFGCDWDDYIEGYFVGRWRDIVSYRIDTYSYSGGAHGSIGTYCYNFNVNTGDIVKDRQIFVDGFETRMGELLTSHLCDSFNCDKDLDSIFVSEIMPSADYCVTSTGIDYIYEEYELGPAYLGCIKVHVPWSELKEILR